VVAGVVAACRAPAQQEQRDAEVHAAPSSAAPIASPIAAPIAPPKAPLEAFDGEPYREAAIVPALTFAAVTASDVVVLGATGQGATVDTPFQAASIGKTVIALCVMQMVEAKKLDLDADVSAYVGFAVKHPTAKEPITLRHLLNHRSSIKDIPGEIRTGRAVSLGDFVRRELVTDAGAPRAASFLDGGPPAKWTYSNLGSSLAAYAVERVSGSPFSHYADAQVFAPLGMKNTSYVDRGAATPHAYKDKTQRPLPQPYHAVYPSIDMRSTARDLARYTQAVARGGELDGVRVLSADGVKTLTAGLGWQLRTFEQRKVAGHESEDYGASTVLYVDPVASAGVVVLSNGDAFAGGDAARTRALQNLVIDLFARTAARR
jgi:CubicO group peptidase (beta-lactamase class C family)